MPQQFPARAIILALVYVAIMGMGMFYMYHLRGVAYGAPRMLEVFLPVQVFVTAIALYLCHRWFGWAAIGFGRLKAVHLLWMAPYAVIIIIMGSNLLSGLTELQTVPWSALAIVAFVTFLVGVGEEVTFRGALLHGWLARLPVAAAMGISAVGFSLLHAVNIFGGQSVEVTLSQLVSTLLVGLLFAPLALLLQSLWPLIIAHFLWDFMLIAGGAIGVNPLNDMTALLYSVSTIALIPVLWFIVIKRDRQGLLQRPPLPEIRD